MLSIPSRQSPNRQCSISASTTADEIQRWKVDSLDNEYLCREDVLKEHFFWNLIQCQKDQLYNFYVEEEARLIESTMSWTEIANGSLKEASSQAVINSHIVHLTFLLEQVQMFQEFIREREEDFIEVLNAYDKCHGTNVRPSEVYELRTTHTFLNGRRLNELELELKQCIIPLEEAVEKLDSKYLAGIDTVISTWHFISHMNKKYPCRCNRLWNESTWIIRSVIQAGLNNIWFKGTNLYQIINQR